MKRYFNHTPVVIKLICLMAFLSSCRENDGLIENPPTVLTFDFQKINSDDENNYSVRSFESSSKGSSWDYGIYDQIALGKIIKFNSQLENGEELEFQIWALNREKDKDLLLLSDEDSMYFIRNWDYKSTEVEISNFWNTARYFAMINYKNLYNLEVKSCQKVLVDGQEKTYLEIRFDGNAFGGYDPNNEGEGYEIKNGVFKGIIE